MSEYMIPVNPPKPISEIINKLPDKELCLGWGVQALSLALVRNMVVLATKESDEFRYAIGVSLGVGQMLYEMPEGSVIGRDQFIRCEQVGSLIGHFDLLDTHIIAEAPQSDDLDETLILMILNEDKLVVGYLVTAVRPAQDHVTKTMPIKTT